MRRLVVTSALIVAATAAGAAPPAETNVRAALERIARIDPQLHSVIAVDPTAIDQARRIDAGGLRGPLAGQPVLIKDNIEMAGPLPTTAGSLALAANVTGRDAPLVVRLRAAGAVIIGKTNLSEWANIRSNHSISGWSAVGGQTHNPWALDRDPCGSSSGSAAAVAAGLVRLAIGTETDGSVTCPAALNGIVGLKPTVGLVSRTRVVPISHSQDTAGPMAASVSEAAALLAAIAGSDPADPATRDADRHKRDYAAALDANSLNGKRIGVMRFASGFGTDTAFETALAILRERGATLVDIKKFDDSAIGKNENLVLLTELKVDLAKYLRGSPAPIPVRSLADVIAFDDAREAGEMSLFGQDTFEKAEKTRGLSDPAYVKARAASFSAAGPNGIDRLLRQYRVVALVGPTMPPAWKIDAVNGDQSSGGGAGSLAAVAGYPHLTVPMGLVKGLPVGLSFIGPKWSEALLLSLGYAYEQARGPFPAPKFYRSIEEQEPQVAPFLQPRLQSKSSQADTREHLISNMKVLFHSWDRDGDGRLSRTEVTTAINEGVQIIEQDAAKRRSLADWAGIRREGIDYYASQDANHDGYLTLDELLKDPLANFDCMDKNHEQILTKEEVFDAMDQEQCGTEFPHDPSPNR